MEKPQWTVALGDIERRIGKCNASRYVLARHAGLSPSTVCRLLAGKSKPRPPTLLRLERACDAIEEKVRANPEAWGLTSAPEGGA